jgi:hypothetical protein
MRGMGDDSEWNEFGPYHFWRWLHLALFFVMAVGCGLLAGPESEDPKDASFFAMALAAGVICLLVEACLLAVGRWRVSLAYLLLVTTYLALTGGAAIAAFNLTRNLFAD